MVNSLPWVSTRTPPALAEHELHVWRTSIDVPPVLLQQFESTLNASEKERAEKFLVPQARERFVAARGILRGLLATYLEIDPVRVEFRYGPQGKPSPSAVHNSQICFSMSHSQGMGVFAFTSDCEVGVDVEQIKANFKGMEIASHFFSGEEIAALAKLPPELATEAFFGCWTRKEAYIKARGQGLSIPLASFTVRFADSKQLLRDEEGTPWACYALEPAAGFAGAVVAKGENWNLKYWEWSAGIQSAAQSNSNTSV
ncbi:MAG: 4-phosphopantetheinyl transferase [Candidatus Acidoferrum typicum]|nr:4-phosphopantetheinyl transferase [Candidatus Acidoferrum typicum]